jgi:hypothetical protein
MPATQDDLGSGPDWVHWVGCVHPGWDRECLTCGARWSVSDEQRFPRRRDRSP